MADLNEFGEKPQKMQDAEAKPEGISLFFNDKEAALFMSAGREITEKILSEFFILYRVDLEKTQTDFYGQAKKKVYLPEIQIYGRINVEAKDPEMMYKGGIEKKGMGNLTAHVYLSHLEELGLIEKRESTNTIVTGIKMGHFIGYKGQFYKIINDGYSQISNEFSWAGDRRFYITITAVEVDEDVFKAR
jgi:hypothetical protein